MKTLTPLSDATVAEMTARLSAIINTKAGTRAKLAELHCALADEFARRRGWRRSDRGFAFKSLSAYKNDRTFYFETWASIPGGMELRIIDHPDYFREIERPYRPVAIAAHLYDKPLAFDQIARRVDHLGVDAELVRNYPSWYYPTATSLVLYKRRNIAPVPDHLRSRKLWPPALSLRPSPTRYEVYGDSDVDC